MSFFSKLESRAERIDSLLCVGLDPHPQDLPQTTSNAVYDFCARLIDATSEIAVAYKPNMAFFEALGSDGITALKRVITSVPDGIPVILDAKRGDIASTADAYATAVFNILKANAVTLNPYLGADAIRPFIGDAARGVFLLCKTSNPGAADLQDLVVLNTIGNLEDRQPRKLFEAVALLAARLNEKDNIGLVVGATQLEALSEVRSLVPNLWFLAPGVGAQGADLGRALTAGLRSDGWGMLIPVSRGISRSKNPRLAAQELRDAINHQRASIQKKHSIAKLKHKTLAQYQSGLDTASASIADELLASGCTKFGEFKLKSGLESPIYLDLRRLASYPELLRKVALAYLPLLKKMSFDRIAALPYAALPIGTAISLLSGVPMVYPRKEVKKYGTRSAVEGDYLSGERVVLIDDLATTGGSKFEAINNLRAVGLKVSDVVVLVDRQSGAKEILTQKGYRFHAVFTLSQLLDYWEETQQVPSTTLETVREFLSHQGAV